MAGSLTTCDNIEIRNAYWNNKTWTPNQSLIEAPLLPSLRLYIVVGAIASVFNVICILIFVTKKDFRKRYLLFAVLAFGNLINTIFAFEAGVYRIYLIDTNQYAQLRSTFECLLQPGPHLQLLGGQLPAVVLVVIDIERLIAVYKPVFYKVHINFRIRIFMVIGTFAAVIVSLLFGYLSSYMNRNTCANALCAILSAYGLRYSNYHSAIVILFPIIAVILNTASFIGAKKLSEQANKKKEINLVFITLIITIVDVVVIVVPNVVLFGVYNQLWTLSSSTTAYFYVLFCSNSAINLFVYIFLKRDFRDHLLMLMSWGKLKPYLKHTVEVAPSQNRRIMISRAR